MGPQRDIFRFVTHFWDGVDRGAPNDCWPWTRSKKPRGYGSLGYHNPVTNERIPLVAHRVAYHLTHGAPPPGYVVMHTCDNPPCCNPAHLVIGTIADNNSDRAKKGRTARPGIGRWNYRRDLSKTPRGVRVGGHKLTDSDVKDIRNLLAEGRLTQRQIAAEYGVSQGTIKNINIGHTWRHVT